MYAPQVDFPRVVSDLQKYYTDELKKTECKIDNKNYEVFSLLEQGTWKIDDEIENQIEQAIILKSQKEEFQVLATNLEYLVTNYNPSIAKTHPENFEEILWILRKDRKSVV